METHYRIAVIVLTEAVVFKECVVAADGILATDPGFCLFSDTRSRTAAAADDRGLSALHFTVTADFSFSRSCCEKNKYLKRNLWRSLAGTQPRVKTAENIAAGRRAALWKQSNYCSGERRSWKNIEMNS